METKICKNCKENKETNLFSKNKNSKDGMNHNCKLCMNVYYLNNIERIKNKGKEWRGNNPENIIIAGIKYKELNPDYGKDYYNNNKLKLNYNSREYQKENREVLNEYRRNRYNNDPLFRMKDLIRSHIHHSFKFNKLIKGNSTKDILGCSFKEFKQHIESLFKPWMNWENQGDPKDGILEFNKTWDLDHIIPISSANSEEDVIRLNHYTNFQPLCSKINREVKRNTL